MKSAPQSGTILYAARWQFLRCTFLNCVVSGVAALTRLSVFFRDLKQNHEEVDVERAIEVDRSDSVDSLLSQDKGHAGDGNDADDETTRGILLRLPGVNVHVARRIMQNCDSLAELADLSRDELRCIAGPAAGQKLFSFVRQDLGSKQSK